MFWLEWKPASIFLNNDDEDGCYIGPEVCSLCLNQSILYLDILFHDIYSPCLQNWEHNNQYYVSIGCLFEIFYIHVTIGYWNPYKYMCGCYLMKWRSRYASGAARDWCITRTCLNPSSTPDWQKNP